MFDLGSKLSGGYYIWLWFGMSLGNIIARKKTKRKGRLFGWRQLINTPDGNAIEQQE